MSMEYISETHEIDAFERSQAARIIAKLSQAMAAVMLQHGDGPQPIVAGSNHANTVIALRDRGLLQSDRLKTPQHTRATRLGRRVIAMMLAEEAEVLSRQAAVMA